VDHEAAPLQQILLLARAPSVLDPQGPGAARVASLWWVMLAIALVVLTVVVAMLVAAVLRGRRGGSHGRDAGRLSSGEARWGEPFIVVAGFVIPALILVALFVVSLRAMAALRQPAQAAGLEVRVTGHMWWWEAQYPNGAVTANEIHVPAGRPVRFTVTSADVIHSFWVPQLQVKADMIPGKVNTLSIQADKPGRWRGQCAEFCGLQHAQMIFWVVADPPAAFDRWMAREALTAAEPTDPGAARGREVFLDQTCAGCHAIRGTPASSARVGPDLTHLASRSTIAAGVLPQTRAALAAWVTDPQIDKPGAVMPPTALTAAELDALLDYLETLR
jgi:cytochrome c oxidase subunit 2